MQPAPLRPASRSRSGHGSPGKRRNPHGVSVGCWQEGRRVGSRQVRHPARIRIPRSTQRRRHPRLLLLPTTEVRTQSETLHRKSSRRRARGRGRPPGHDHPTGRQRPNLRQHKPQPAPMVRIRVCGRTRRNCAVQRGQRGTETGWPLRPPPPQRTGWVTRSCTSCENADSVGVLTLSRKTDLQPSCGLSVRCPRRARFKARDGPSSRRTGQRHECERETLLFTFFQNFPRCVPCPPRAGETQTRTNP